MGPQIPTFKKSSNSQGNWMVDDFIFSSHQGFNWIIQLYSWILPLSNLSWALIWFQFTLLDGKVRRGNSFDLNGFDFSYSLRSTICLFRSRLICSLVFFSLSTAFLRVFSLSSSYFWKQVFRKAVLEVPWHDLVIVSWALHIGEHHSFKTLSSGTFMLSSYSFKMHCLYWLNVSHIFKLIHILSSLYFCPRAPVYLFIYNVS